MDDKANIRFVYAHSEGDRGHDDIHFLHQEPVLIVGACLCVESRMVRGGLDAVYVEQFGQFLHLLAAEAVYDA